VCVLTWCALWHLKVSRDILNLLYVRDGVLADDADQIRIATQLSGDERRHADITIRRVHITNERDIRQQMRILIDHANGALKAVQGRRTDEEFRDGQRTIRIELRGTDPCDGERLRDDGRSVVAAAG
jgi:hypothetical protein